MCQSLTHVGPHSQSLIIGALAEAPCALIVALVGHFLLAPTGTADADLTTQNKQAGNVMIAFAIIQVGGPKLHSRTSVLARF